MPSWEEATGDNEGCFEPSGFQPSFAQQVEVRNGPRFHEIPVGENQLGDHMTANRWGIAAAGVVLQVALGAAYAWSVFRVPLSKQFGWGISEVTLTFTGRCGF